VTARAFVIWGASGHAMVLRELLARGGDRVVALFDNDPAVRSPWADLTVHIGAAAFTAWCARGQPRPLYGAVAVGGARGSARRELAEILAAAGVELPALVHPAATIAADAAVGQACQIMAGAVVGACVQMGDSVIVNTAASADHECRLGSGVHLAPRATLCGCVTVGENTLIGPGAVVLPRVRIGANTVIGAGAIVTRDVPDGVVAWGCPARVIRHNVGPVAQTVAGHG
jgi:sugar O-acyltransferase (sialic acid O-acetyltransferase NeuD family)